MTLSLTTMPGTTLTAAPPAISFRQTDGKIGILAGDQPVATYVYQDQQITRPYFCDLNVPGGIQVTRHHPPRQGIDLVDHATFHPGLWLAFGDLSGQDDWRNKAKVRHRGLKEIRLLNDATGSFTVENDYCRADNPDQTVCQETCRYTITSESDGYLLICDSSFQSPQSFWFGDQEEMGLGVRLATPITVKSGGRIIDAAGRINEKQIWGKPTEWCDYAGTINGRHVGVLVMADPANFRPMRMHVRDYGLLTANPFGQKSFGGTEASRIEVSANQPFRLRFAIFLHASETDWSRQSQVYADVVKRLTALPRP